MVKNAGNVIDAYGWVNVVSPAGLPIRAIVGIRPDPIMFFAVNCVDVGLGWVQDWLVSRGRGMGIVRGLLGTLNTRGFSRSDQQCSNIVMFARYSISIAAGFTFFNKSPIQR